MPARIRLQLLELPVCVSTNIAQSPPFVARYPPLRGAVVQGGSVLGQRGAAALARACRRAGLAGAVACAALGAAPPALADRGPRPDPSELWRAYPLEQKPSTVAKSPAAATAATPGNERTAATPDADHDSAGPAPGVIAAIGFATALLAAAAMALRRRHRDRAATALPRAAPRAAPLAGPPAQRAIEPPRSTPPRAATRSPATQLPAAAPPPAANRNGRAAAARKTPVCQVRWNAVGRWFYAAYADAAGVERLVAASERLEGHRSQPPDETPEARAALRNLAKDLRGQGWRPLRARGIDFDERRWYARRFRQPTDEELAEAARADEVR
jgi:hypothetical protein